MQREPSVSTVVAVTLCVLALFGCATRTHQPSPDTSETAVLAGVAREAGKQPSKPEQSEPGTTTARRYAEVVALTMRTDTARKLAEGKISTKVAACVGSTTAAPFEAMYLRVLPLHFNPNELAALDEFMDTAAGRKYVLRAGHRVAQSLASSLPAYTAAESEAIAVFASTPAGKKFIKDQVLRVGEARRELTLKFEQILGLCGANEL